MPRIPTLAGGIDARDVRGAVLGEHLIATLPVDPGNAATDVWFAQQPLTIERLGDVMLGRANRDDATLTERTAQRELATFAEAGGNVVLELSQPWQASAPAALEQAGRLHGVHVVGASAAGEAHGPLAARLGEGKAGVILLDVAGEPSAARGGGGVGTGSASSAAQLAFEAALATGAPILARTQGDLERALELAASGIAAGLGTTQLALSNARDWAHQPDALRELAQAGAMLHFTGLGRVPSVYTTISDHDVAVAIAGLVADGHGDRVLLGTGVDRKHAGVSHGGNGVAFLQRQFLPYLGFVGVDPKAAQALAAANAAAFLCWTETGA